ncbi:kinase subdomain-containing protein [Aureobasidium pullulans]|uniref:Kinase subdomain-containing protein n=1 Tax=Aureobasidium pullulans TaxID=5580 RepID=A0A4S9C0B1_AURPU|nr:kinase subdomain-containing protein [Aureobasidium pullulans]
MPAALAADEAEPHDIQTLAINDTAFNRLFTRLALKTWGRLYKSNGFCSPISRKKIVKTGPYVHLTEAATMRYIAENTSIPVPKVHCAFTHKDRSIVVMERIHGEVIPAAWNRLGEEGRAKIFAQLKGMIEEMRCLKPPPGTGVQSCVGGSLYDSRMNRNETRFGPFATIQEFHIWLRKGFRSTDHTQSSNLESSEEKQLEEMEAMQDGRRPHPVFTHADLNPFNILVRGEQVVGIIDCEFAGWYPHYWEYTSAWFGNLVRTGWQDRLSRFLETFPAEFEMEKTRNKWWGEF